MRVCTIRWTIVAAAALIAGACADPTTSEVAAATQPTVVQTATPVATSTSAPATPTATPPEPTPSPTPTPTPTPEPDPTMEPRAIVSTQWEAFATTGPVTLTYPASAIEYIGFHESGHDGAQMMDALDITTPTVTLESRERDTGSRTAADVAVQPGMEIRSPVTGTVLSAGTYVLYCDHSDDFVFIEPDTRPGWQVKMFHIDGVQVVPGERVEAGVTVLAPRATVLPFASQVDEFTASPSWPHVHIEVVDPSIPDRPTGPGC